MEIYGNRICIYSYKYIGGMGLAFMFGQTAEADSGISWSVTVEDKIQTAATVGMAKTTEL